MREEGTNKEIFNVSISWDEKTIMTIQNYQIGLSRKKQDK